MVQESDKVGRKTGFEWKWGCLTRGETGGKAGRMGVTRDKLLFGKGFWHMGRAQRNVFSLFDEVILRWDRLCCF